MTEEIDIFISYKREDEVRVDKLADVLTSMRLNVWTDASLKGGEEWQRRIRENAERAACILVCWSEACARSEWVQAEMAIPRRRGVMQVVQFGPGSLPVELGVVHCPDLTRWDGEADHKGLRQLADGLGAVLDKPIASWLAERIHGQAPAVVAELRALLVGMARQRTSPIDYTSAYRLIAPLYVEGARTPMRVLYASLDAIADQNRKYREPPLFGLVVNHQTGLPGQGYFQKHAYLANEQHPLARELHEAHLQRVYAYAWPRDA